MRIRTARTHLLWALPIAVQGCFLPVPFNETGSPPLVGFMRRSDGTAAVGWRVAVTSVYDDSTCAEARALATTDSVGRFQLPRTLVRRRGILLVPAFESFGNLFALCSSRGPEDVMRSMYRGIVGFRVDGPPHTVVCSEWVWEQRERIACSTREESKVVEGGRWSADGRRGRYRLVLTEELGPAPGYRIPVPRPRAYVLWLLETAEGLPLGAIETVQLPIDDRVTALVRVDLLERNGRFYAAFSGYKKKFMNDFASAELAFELGPPGKVTKVAGP